MRGSPRQVIRRDEVRALAGSWVITGDVAVSWVTGVGEGRERRDEMGLGLGLRSEVRE